MCLNSFGLPGSYCTCGKYRVSTQVLVPHINLRTATTIAINLVSRYSKMPMRDRLQRHLTANNGVSVPISKTVEDPGKESIKIVERL
ncbi:hypothetical protein AVEN_199021-1 [Araneus ventricosus]|uniref:Uncharacterized protein n=1 Tax=Araneus ventricosus TaxID=182803 RepID=A0A4Y2WZC5_ARAVE|nr:hypothetical protein AVEN_199021-1 [Araneus ventricosus]